MEITNEDLKEFRELYYAETGVELDDETALKKARALLILMKFATDPVGLQVEEPDDSKQINQ